MRGSIDIIAFIIRCTNDQGSIQAKVPAKSKSPCLFFIQVGSLVCESVSLVESKVDQQGQGFIPSPGIIEFEIQPPRQLSEVKGLQPGIDVSIWKLHVGNRPDIPALDHSDRHVKMIRTVRDCMGIYLHKVEQRCVKDILFAFAE